MGDFAVGAECAECIMEDVDGRRIEEKLLGVQMQFVNELIVSRGREGHMRTGCSSHT